MNPRVSFFLIGLLSYVAWASAVAQTTALNGHINGIEFCFQSVPECGYAGFVGTFTGKVNGNDTTAVFTARVNHAVPLNETNRGVTAVTEGEWSLITPNTTIKGTVKGGTLTFHQNNTFAVDLTLPIEGSSSTAMFDGTLNHNVFPPTVTGRLRSK